MVFSGNTFLFFFLPVVLIFYWLQEIWQCIKSVFCKGICKSNGASKTYKNYVLLIFSLIFYAWGEPAFLLIMLLSIFANYRFGLLVIKENPNAKKWLWASVVFNLGILYIFKYLNFTLDNLNLLFNTNIALLNIVLPLGISFFTFQAMSYVIDVYHGKVEAQKSIVSLGLYISMFAQLVAGPIVRYETIAKEINERTENYDDFSEGVTRFIYGLAKKVIIANNVAQVADAAFKTDFPQLSIAFAWLGAIAYTLQIYFDFSGYSDMAIGLGKMFGFHFLENFNYPYLANSITDFWRRWHISLSSWFRDYVYFPLGGSRVESKAKHVFNLFVVWLLTGIWHGANWTFIVWGMFYFLLLVLEKKLKLDKNKSFCGWLYTDFTVILAWVIFRADSIGNAYRYLLCMFGLGTDKLICDFFMLHLSDSWKFLLLGLIFCFPIQFEKLKTGGLMARIAFVAGLFILFLFTLTFVICDSYNPFIYFNF